MRSMNRVGISIRDCRANKIKGTADYWSIVFYVITDTLDGDSKHARKEQAYYNIGEKFLHVILLSVFL